MRDLELHCRVHETLPADSFHSYFSPTHNLIISHTEPFSDVLLFTMMYIYILRCKWFVIVIAQFRLIVLTYCRVSWLSIVVFTEESADFRVRVSRLLCGYC
jgi:hypothetical protein